MREGHGSFVGGKYTSEMDPTVTVAVFSSLKFVPRPRPSACEQRAGLSK